MTKGSRHVYTSGVSEVEKAMWKTRAPVDSTTGGRGAQLASVEEPLPSQKYTYQRGLARAALRLPKREQVVVLAEVLAAMGLYERIFRAEEEVP